MTRELSCLSLVTCHLSWLSITYRPVSLANEKCGSAPAERARACRVRVSGRRETMASEMVSFKSNGGTTEGYLSVPESGRGPGVVVIQEWWGLVPHIKHVADRFAAEGFVALAPDLYHGRATTSPGEAGKLMMALDIDPPEKDLRGAIQY